MQKVLLYVYKFSCDDAEIKAPGISGLSYGEFLAHSPTGYVAYLDATADPHFTEIAEIEDNLDLLSKKNQWEIADIHHGIYGKVCDPAPDGSEFKTQSNPTCPICGTDRIYTQTPTNPFEHVEVPCITYKKWDALNEFEKRNLIQNLVESYLAKHEAR